jgi:hypothetical protein
LLALGSNQTKLDCTFKRFSVQRSIKHPFLPYSKLLEISKALARVGFALMSSEGGTSKKDLGTMETLEWLHVRRPRADFHLFFFLYAILPILI